MLGLYATLHTFVSTRLARDEKGATAVEYALMVGLIAVVLIGGVSIFGNEMKAFFTGLGDQLKITKTGA